MWKRGKRDGFQRYENERNEKARPTGKKKKTRTARQRRWCFFEAIETGRASRASIRRTGMGAPCGKTNLAGDETDFGDGRRDAFHRRQDQRVDDRAIADGATNIAGFEREGGSRAGAQDQAAIDEITPYLSIIYDLPLSLLRDSCGVRFKTQKQTEFFV